ncbi:uncharacterized protein METZ01_LOCUS5721, partial [marine metagenome]
VLRDLCSRTTGDQGRSRRNVESSHGSTAGPAGIDQLVGRPRLYRNHGFSECSHTAGHLAGSNALDSKCGKERGHLHRCRLTLHERIEDELGFECGKILASSSLLDHGSEVEGLQRRCRILTHSFALPTFRS